MIENHKQYNYCNKNSTGQKKFFYLSVFSVISLLHFSSFFVFDKQKMAISLCLTYCIQKWSNVIQASQNNILFILLFLPLYNSQQSQQKYLVLVYKSTILKNCPSEVIWALAKKKLKEFITYAIFRFLIMFFSCDYGSVSYCNRFLCNDHFHLSCF